MSVDKVKPLKMENPATGGTQSDGFPTETDPSQDYLSTKGIAFEGLDTFRSEKLGRALVQLFPDMNQVYTYLSDKRVDYIEFFNSSSHVTANRVGRREYTYNVNKTVATETLKIYDTDGTTVLRTYTWTHSYSGVDLTETDLVIT